MRRLGFCVGPGAWLWISVPVLLWAKRREFEIRRGKERAQGESLQGRLSALEEQHRQRQGQIGIQEEEIQTIAEQYDLSKQFLATLDWEQGLQITREALLRWLPTMGEEERASTLQAIRSLMERGEISIGAFLRAFPSDRRQGGSQEGLGIVSAQVALGLRRVSLYRQIQESAIHDGLTGLLVRRHFRQRLEEEVDRALRRGTSLAFLMVDLDHFKEVNDTYGHLVGDVVLREVANLLRRSVREIDGVGRYGGEEFAVLLPEADRPFAIGVANRIRQMIGQTWFKAYDEEIQITVSVGVALCPEEARGVDALIEQADRAMYQAKDQGRNQTVTLR